MAENTYAGESIAKKVARVRLYRRTRQALKYNPFNRAPKVLFLPGPRATEIGALKHLLGAEAKNVVGIDRDPTACLALKERWPGVTAINADLDGNDAVPLVNEILRKHGGGGFEFVHLDLMGTLSANSELLYGRWGHAVAQNGVMAVTYLRGREVPGRDPHIDRIRSAAAEEAEVMRRFARKPSFDKNHRETREYLKLIEPDAVRALAHITALNHSMQIAATIRDYGTEASTAYIERMAAAPPPGTEAYLQFMDNLHDEIGMFTALACYSYRADVSPMGVLATHRVLSRTLNSRSYASLRYYSGRDTSSVIRKDAMLDLLAEADSLEKEFTKQQVAEILDVEPGTLASWRAHRTMGSYVR